MADLSSTMQNVGNASVAGLSSLTQMVLQSKQNSQATGQVPWSFNGNMQHMAMQFPRQMQNSYKYTNAETTPTSGSEEQDNTYTTLC